MSVFLAGCGRSSPGDTIDVHSMQNELSLVVHARLLPQGFDYNARVACGPNGQPFTYSCDVLITNAPRGHHVEWTELVVCRAKPLAGVPRCSSNYGYSLQ